MKHFVRQLSLKIEREGDFMLIIVRDYYEGTEVIYEGDNVREAEKAIRQRIDDTSGECEISSWVKCSRGAKTHDCKECKMCKYEEYLDDVAYTYTEEILATL